MSLVVTSTLPHVKCLYIVNLVYHSSVLKYLHATVGYSLLLPLEWDSRQAILIIFDQSTCMSFTGLFWEANISFRSPPFLWISNFSLFYLAGRVCMYNRNPVVCFLITGLWQYLSCKLCYHSLPNFSLMSNFLDTQFFCSWWYFLSLTASNYLTISPSSCILFFPQFFNRHGRWVLPLLTVLSSASTGMRNTLS